MCAFKRGEKTAYGERESAYVCVSKRDRGRKRERQTVSPSLEP